MVVIRPPSYQSHDTQYLAQLAPLQQGQASPGQAWRVWRVPLHLQRLHWTEVINNRSSELVDQLVLPIQSSVKRVLCKLEAEDFIH